jgi:hypothetical protein
MGLFEAESCPRRHAHSIKRNDSEEDRARPITDAVDDDALAAVTDARVLGLVLLEIAAIVARDPQIGRCWHGQGKEQNANQTMHGGAAADSCQPALRQVNFNARRIVPGPCQYSRVTPNVAKASQASRDLRATPGNPDDYDALSGERGIGRIFRSSSAPQERPWMWTITSAVVEPRLPSHGVKSGLCWINELGMR